MVRLAAGLDAQDCLDTAGQVRALDCLARFGERLRDIPAERLRIVGTNTLRKAQNPVEFIARAQTLLGHKIDIISGVEEARLIYVGASRMMSALDGGQLFIDIGGGSTEIITGKGFKSNHRESLHVGCVSLAAEFLDQSKLKKKWIKAAEMAAELAIQPVASMFRRTGWDRAIGCSGTIKAIRTVVQEQGWCDQGITCESLQKLRYALSDFDNIEQLKELDVAVDRRPIFVSGLAILWAVFDQLHLDRMDVSDEALREGVLYDLIGRVQHTDIRENTVQSLLRRWAVDELHAKRVCDTAEKYYALAADDWDLELLGAGAMLRWSALLHEIGLLISHGQYHKHGAYVVGNADLSGFSRRDQSILAALVRGHRRSFPVDMFQSLNEDNTGPVIRLCVLLRLAVLMHRDRSEAQIPDVEFNAQDNNLHLRFPAGWLENNPLTLIDLEQEVRYLKAASINLAFSSKR